MLILLIGLSQRDQSWSALCWMCPIKSMASGGRSCTKEACMVQSLQHHEEEGKDGGSPGGKDCLQCCQAYDKVCLLAGKVWHRGRRACLQMGNLFPVSPNQQNCITQDVVGENCTCNDAGELALTVEYNRHGFSTILDYSMSSFWRTNELPTVPQTAIGRRASFWICTRAKVKPLTMAIFVFSSLQTKS